MYTLLGNGLVALATLAATAAAVNPVVIQGQEFVDSVTKDRLVIIGVDYQPGGSSGYDPNVNQDTLSNATTCLRDAAVMQALGVNTIRVYNVDPAANHDECASIFNTAGIYMLLDVNSPQESLNQNDPAGSYTLDYVTRIFGVVEAFKGYPNTLAFFAANEVMNSVNTSQANPPYIRAVQRDLREYIAKHSQRSIPVGYSAADVRDILQDTWAYLQCNDGSGNDMSRSEFFGLNSYSWCGASSYHQSTYDQLVGFFKDSSIPVFFSEYGCNLVEPRIFSEVQAIYGVNMTSLSGGLVYEYSEEPDNYGLVSITSAGAVSLRPDYDNLQAQYDKIDIKMLQSTSTSQTSINPPACSAGLISDSGFSTNFTVPPQPSGVADLINNGISNPNQGKIVSVPNLTPSLPIYASNGKPLSLSVNAINGVNTPSGVDINGTTTAGKPGKKSAAVRSSVSGLSGFAWGVGLVAALVWL